MAKKSQLTDEEAGFVAAVAEPADEAMTQAIASHIDPKTNAFNLEMYDRQLSASFEAMAYTAAAYAYSRGCRPDRVNLVMREIRRRLKARRQAFDARGVAIAAAVEKQKTAEDTEH